MMKRLIIHSVPNVYVYTSSGGGLRTKKAATFQTKRLRLHKTMNLAELCFKIALIRENLVLHSWKCTVRASRELPSWKFRLDNALFTSSSANRQNNSKTAHLSN